jgi:hypothetical protein
MICDFSILRELRRQHEEDRAELREERRRMKIQTAAIIALLIYNSFFLLVDRFTVGIGWYQEQNPSAWIVKALCILAFPSVIVFFYAKTKIRRQPKANGEK